MSTVNIHFDRWEINFIIPLCLIQTCDEITDETNNIPSTFDINKHKKFYRINSALRVQSELEADPPLDTGVSLLFLIRIRALVSSRASCVPFSSNVFATFRAIVFVFKLLWNLLRMYFFSQLFRPRSNVSYERISENKNISARGSIDGCSPLNNKRGGLRRFGMLLSNHFTYFQITYTI